MCLSTRSIWPRWALRGIDPAATGRPSYHPSVLLKLYIYGYLNRVQSSRRLEREAGRNVEVMWLLGRLAPDHKTIADFRKDNGLALRKVCARFVELCREMGLLATASVGHRWQQVQGREQSRQELHTSEGRAAACSAGGERRALPEPTRHLFLTKTLPKVAAEMALSVLAYNLTRVMNIVGIKSLIAAIVA
jgi:Transposase domain (DUF772)